MSTFIVLLIVAILTIGITSFKLDRINEKFQEYIYIPPQSVVSNDDSYAQQYLMMPTQNWGGYGLNPFNPFNPFNSQYPQYPIQNPQYPIQNPQYPIQNPKYPPNIDTKPEPDQPKPEPEPEPIKPAPAKPDPAPSTETEPSPAAPAQNTPSSDSTSTTTHSHGSVQVGTNDDGEKNPRDPGAFPIYDEESSLHQSFTDGDMLNPNKLDPIFHKLKLISPEAMISKLTEKNQFTHGQPPNKQLAVAYLVLSTIAKLKILPGELFEKQCPNWRGEQGNDKSCNAAGKAYGLMKYHSVRKEWAKVSAIIKQNGGNDHGLSPEEIMTLWAANEHHNLHCCLNPAGDVGNAVHMTSLNNRAHVTPTTPGKCESSVFQCRHPEVLDPTKDIVCEWPDIRKKRNDMADGDGSLCNEGWRGGYNDTGRHHQHGWYRNVMNLKNLGFT